MKRLVLTAGVLLIASTAIAAVAERTVTLAGRVQTPKPDEIVLAADAQGDMAGYFTLSVHRNGRSLDKGTWVLIHRVPNPDGSETEVGMLEGTVTSVSAAFADDGALVSMSGVELKVDSGSGGYEGVVTGSGKVDGTIGGANGASFSVTLKLDF